MNKAILSVGIILLSAMAFVLINLITSANTGSELDYYLVKETTEAAMLDARDFNYYSVNGVIRMDSDKFVESFLRRFAESVDNTREYDVRFYDLNEVPPKVSVKVDSLTVLSFKNEQQQTNGEITTTISQIVETQVTKNDASPLLSLNTSCNNEISDLSCAKNNFVSDDVKTA